LPDGRWLFRFMLAGHRKTLHLGKLNQANAENVALRLSRLVSAYASGDPLDGETLRWVGELDDRFRSRLAAHGLVKARAAVPLFQFVEEWIGGQHGSCKASTIEAYEAVYARVRRFFADNPKLRDITPGHADAFARWMRKPDGGNLSPATAAKTISVTRQFFKAAVRWRMIAENPFDGIPGTVKPNRERDHFVTGAEAAAILDACPNADYRVAFALARYGGLRCPSEVRALRWADIDWARGRMRVRSPKTAHHEGHASRLVPLFPELLPYLRDAFESPEGDTRYVVNRDRWSGKNPRTHLVRLIRKAGLVPWSKCWQNLRASRATELRASFPEHVVNQWLGHAQKVAEAFYLQTTEGDFDRALHQTTVFNGPSCTKPHEGPGFCTGKELSLIRSGLPGLEPGTF